MRDYQGRLTGIGRDLTDPDTQRELKRLWDTLKPLDSWAREASRGMRRITNGQVPTGSGASIATADPVALDQYFFLPGRPGGQTATGGTNAADPLWLISTSDPSKGKILFGAAAKSAYDEATERLGIGTQTPTATFHVKQSGTDTLTIWENSGGQVASVNASGKGRFRDVGLEPSSGGVVTLAAPAAATAYTATWPGGLPAADRLLRSDSSGNLSFSQVDLGADVVLTGTLPVGRGGTALASTGTANQVLGVASASGTLEYKTVTGAGSVSVSHSAGVITVSGTSASTNVTGVLATGGSNQVLGMSASATSLEYKTITGAGIVTVSNSAGLITVSATSQNVTGVLATGAASQVLGMATAGGTLEYKTITGSGAASVTNSSGLVTVYVASTNVTGALATGGSNQVLGMNSAGTALEYKTVTGAGIVSVTNSAGVITVSASGGGTSTSIFATAASVSITGTASQFSPTDGSPFTVFSSNGTYTLASAPTITTGRDGQYLTLVNTGSNTVTLQDISNSGAPATTIRLLSTGGSISSGTTRAIPGGTAPGYITLQYSAGLGAWVELHSGRWQAFSPSVASFTVFGGASVVHEVASASVLDSAPTFAMTYVGVPTAATIDIDAGDAGTDYPFSVPSAFLTALGTAFFRGTSIGGVRTFTLSATASSVLVTRTVGVTYYNMRYAGVSTGTSLTSAQTVALGVYSATPDNSNVGSFPVNASGSNYAWYAHRAALGSSIYFAISSERAGFEAPATTNVTGQYGFAENFNQYRSSITGLGNVTVSVQAGQPNNRFYMGPNTQAAALNSAQVLALDDTASGASKLASSVLNAANFTVTITGSNYLWFSHPASVSDLATIKDHTTGFGIDGAYVTSISVTGQYGFAENYRLWRSTNVGVFPSANQVDVT